MKQSLKLLLSVIAGNTLLAFSICALVIPNQIMLGGSTGIALAIQQFLPVRLSILSAVVNIALFLLGWACLGWKFAATSLMSTIVYPVILAVLEELPLGNLFHEDPVICALFCGILMGLGIGLVVRAGGSTGGMDIPPCILYKFKGVPVGTSLMVFDTIIVLMQVAIQGLDGVLCSILVIAVMSFTVNRTIVSGDKKIQVIIISSQSQQIRDMILHKVNCGVSMLNIETGYQGVPQQAVLSVVYASRYPVIRDEVLLIDKHAFIVASDVTNVNGRGYTLSRTDDVPTSPR